MSVISSLKKTGIYCSDEIRATFHKNLQQDRSESSIAVNPLDNDNLIGVSKLFSDPIKYKFTVAAIYSTDGGNSWKESQPLTLLPGWEGLSDPCLAFDQNGIAYLITESLNFNYKSDPDYDAKIDTDIEVKEMVVYKSGDQGATWGKPIIVVKGDFDRPWITTDNNNGNIYCAWGVGKIQFARSGNGGKNWNGVGKQSIYDSLANTIIPKISIDTKSIIHLVSMDTTTGYISYLRSTDRGESFEAERQITAKILPPRLQFPGAKFRVEGGATACTLKNKVIVAWADYRDDVSRIYITYSDDSGATWPDGAGSPLLSEITHSDRFHDFHPQVGATGGGAIGCAFYRYYEDSKLIDVMFTASFDGGKTFMSPEKLNSTPWNPDINAPLSRGKPGETFIGDYFGLNADQKNFYVLWTNTKDGVQELYFNTVYTTIHTILISDARKRPKFEIIDIMGGIDIEVLKGVAVDGGGYVIVNGKIIKVPPRGPYDKIVHTIASAVISPGQVKGMSVKKIRRTSLNKRLR